MFSTRTVFLDGVKAHEGGTYTDGRHPYDPGGPTKWGITIPDIPGATAATIKALTWAQASPIYIRKYWEHIRADDMPAGVDYTVADYGVHSGTRRAVKVLQRILGVTEDGVVGNETLGALSKHDPDQVIDAINDERMAFLRSLRIWPTYANGFTTRVREVRATSHTLVQAMPAPAPTPAPSDVSFSPKATHKDPKVAKTVIKGSPVAGGAGFFDWLNHHPLEAVVLGVCAVVLIIILVQAINKWHTARNETPMPGTVAVPPKA